MCKFKFFAIIVILIFTSSFLFAQSGSIKGYITDEATGDILPGANVSLEGTSLGASTDLEGKYVINKVPVGHLYILPLLWRRNPGSLRSVQCCVYWRQFSRLFCPDRFSPGPVWQVPHSD